MAPQLQAHGPKLVIASSIRRLRMCIVPVLWKRREVEISSVQNLEQPHSLTSLPIELTTHSHSHTHTLSLSLRWKRFCHFSSIFVRSLSKKASQFFVFFFNSIGVQLTYKVVLVSSVQQRDSVIHIFLLFQILFLYSLLKNIEFLVLYSRSLLIICFIYGSICMLISGS